MIKPPSILADLIQRLEHGDDPTPEELRRTQQLQALHIAKIGEDYLAESVEREDAADQQLQQTLGA